MSEKQPEPAQGINLISLRDWFAANAQLGICSNPNLSWADLNQHEAIANVAYQQADAMLRERERGATE